MTFVEQVDSLWQSVAQTENEAGQWMERIRSEIEICQRLADHRKDKTAEWEKLIAKALKSVRDDLVDGSAGVRAVVEKAEKTLAPIGKELKKYNIYCCGHAHIDMNWLWPWQETVSTTRDTFSTVDKLMESFPQFKFSQDQASTYLAMEEYSPEVFQMLKRRIKEGRWDVTASTWVEGEKNLSSGEALCRHMLYTRRYFKEKFGLPYDYVKIDWEPDMFGHNSMLPAILNRGGVTRYYFCRAGKEPKLFWWEAPDGSRVLAFQDDELWYNGTITPDLTRLLFRFEKATGLKDYLFIYGVGDHGGGPTRRDLVKLIEMQKWPVYPTLKFSKVEDFYTAVEAANPKLPVIKDELNFVFEGCYTSQSSVKRGNRRSENTLPEAEGIALIAGAVAGMPYPVEEIRRGWRHALLCQFHDILPGSGIHATYEYSQGLYQEVAAITESISTRGLRHLASRVNTAAVAGAAIKADGLGAEIGNGLGAGAGDPAVPGGVTAYNEGAPTSQPVLVYNSLAWPRSEMVVAKVWNTGWPHDRIRIRDEEGKIITGQVLGSGDYWGHQFITVGFPARDVPALGYKTFAIEKCAEPVPSKGARIKAREQIWSRPAMEQQSVTLENEYLTVEVESASGAIAHLVDKETGVDYVPAGERMGLLELWQEAPHGMSAWVIGQITGITKFTDGGTLDVTHRGPHRAGVVSRRKFGESSFSLEITLDAGSRQVEFSLSVDWLERGTPHKGVPMLKVAFPVAVKDPEALFEIPFGSIGRPADGAEVPALKWADLSGSNGREQIGVTLVNADKYGHSADGNTLRLTLLRSSYDPDPLPELGAHHVRFALAPHLGAVNVSSAARVGWGFNAPLTAVSTDAHKGDLPAVNGFVRVEPENVMLAAVKKSEDSDAIILRLFEMEGKKTEAHVNINTLVKPDAPAVECDLMEQPLTKSTARMADGVLKVKLPAHGIATVKVG